MISYIIPTRNRHETLQRTLDALVNLHNAEACEGEVIIIDNASESPVSFASDPGSRLPRRIVRLNENIGAAARNMGAQEARGEWLVMLDDDSHPLDLNFIDVLADASNDVAAIGADILLPDGSRERGGLPEVIIGCGAAIRRDAFLAIGGYDPSFDYYAEEYDLCAKFILRGWRIVHNLRFRVLHEKITTGRDFNRIIHRLVRNNGWVAQRYAPDDELDRELSEIVSRYAGIAVKEHAACGFAAGMQDLLESLSAQPRTPMTKELWDRFTGLAHVRATLAREFRDVQPKPVIAIVEPGKNEWAIRQAIKELGLRLTDDEHDADAVVIGTLSPGSMLDARERWDSSGRSVVCPWQHIGVAKGKEAGRRLVYTA